MSYSTGRCGTENLLLLEACDGDTIVVGGFLWVSSREAGRGHHLRGPRPQAVIEIMRFRLAEGVDESRFRAADNRLQTEFAYQQPGLLRRTTARSDDGRWVVVDIWRSAADADACEQRWSGDPVVRDFLRCVDETTLQSERYQELEG